MKNINLAKRYIAKYSRNHNTVPDLCKENARLVLRSLCVDYNYMNFSNPRQGTKVTFCAQFARNSHNCSGPFPPALRTCLEELVERTAIEEKTRGVSKLARQKIVDYFAGMNVQDFRKKLRNKNRKYELVEGALDALSASHCRRELSLISKILVNLAFASFRSDCGYSKYDSIVKGHLYTYLNSMPGNTVVYDKNSFNGNNFNVYLEYCSEIGKLAKLHRVSRFEIDQIIWFFGRVNP